MTAAIERYKRRLKRCLHCGSITKRRLMDRFEGMLNVYLSDSGWPASWPGKQDLENAFGTPEQMARILMDEIPHNVIAKYRRKKRILRVIGAVIVAALLAQVVYLSFFKEFTLTSKGEIIINGTETADATDE